MFHNLKYFEGLSCDALKELEQNIELVHLPVGKLSVFDSDGFSKFIYFPINAVCSVDSVVDEKDPIQLMIFGSNTIVGSAISSTGLRPPGLSTSVVIAGTGGCIPTPTFNVLRSKYPEIDHCLMRLSLYFTWGLAAETACSMVHTPMQRIAERIAKIDSLVGGKKFAATPKFMASSVGCSRSSAHNVLSSLRALKAIDTTDLHIMVCNRAALDTVACGCSRQTTEYASAQLMLPIDEQY